MIIVTIISMIIVMKVLMLMVMGDVVVKPSLISLSDGDCGSAKNTSHRLWLSEDVKHHLCNEYF